MTHAWCSDPARDEAVRAAEDGRQGPLPTLEEAISRAGQFMPPEAPQRQKCTERESGLRTERVVLEVKHELDEPLGDWIVQVIDESLDYDESVRVVEEAHFDDLANMSLERDAAIRQLSAAKNRRDTAALQRNAIRAESYALRDRVAELESQLESVACRAATAETALEAAPAASGWMTAEERDALGWFCGSYGKAITTEQCERWKDAIRSLLARPSPPEVVRPAVNRAAAPTYVEIVEDRDAEWLAAIAAAGVTVKEVVRPGKPLTFSYGHDAIANRDGQWLAAIAAAGVTVKEVGCE